MTIRRLLLLSTILLALAPAAFAQSADLGVVKTVPPTSTAGDVPFSVTITNNGPDPAATVQLTDPLPSGMSFVSATQNTGPSFSCSVPSVGTNGTITCTIATLNTGVTATFTFVGNIPAGTTPGTGFVNTATASSTTPDPNSGNDSGTATVTITATTDLFVSKDGPGTAAAGSDVTFTITAGNGGPDDGNISLSDTLPGTMTFVSITQNSGPALPCPTQPTPGSGGTINCMGTLAAGETVTYSLVANIPGGTSPGTTFTNAATVSGNAFDPNSENNTGAAAVTVPIPNADMIIVKNGPNGAAPDTDVTYDITVVNGGPSPATAASLTDPLPGTMTFVSITQNSGPAFDCSSVPSPGTNGTVTCTIASLGNGVSANFTLVGHIPPGTPQGTSFTNTATVSSSTADDNPDNNQSTTTVTVSAVDLSVTKSGPATVNAGQNISYNLTFANAGPDTAIAANMSDTLPSGTTFVSLTPTGGNVSPFCTTPPPGSAGTVSCSLASFPAGGNASYTLVLNVNGNNGDGTIIANVVTADSDSFDTNPANNSAGSSATVAGVADVGVTKSGPASVVAGSNISYSISVTNSGPSPASNTQLTDNLPAGTTFVSLTLASGPPAICSTPSAGANGTITCTWASLASGATTTYTLVANVPSSATGTVVNTANVSTSTNDPNGANNSSTTTATVTVSADLSVVKTGSASASQTADITYTIVVTNNGASNAQTVALTDTLPATTTFVSNTQTTGPAFACTNPPVGSGGIVSCTIATLNAGASASFTIVVHTSTSTPIGPLSNTANVSAATADPNPANNTSTAVTTIQPAPVPMISPLALLLLCMILAAAGAIVLRD